MSDQATFWLALLLVAIIIELAFIAAVLVAS